MHMLDLYDIMFFIKALQQPSPQFNIYHYILFSSSNTRSSSANKLTHVNTTRNYARNFYFNRLPCRIWNQLPLWTSISHYNYNSQAFMATFCHQVFHPMLLAHIISAADAPNVPILDLQSISCCTYLLSGSHQYDVAICHASINKVFISVPPHKE